MIGRQVVLRMTPEVLMRIERAARLMGLKRQAFLVSAAVEKARQVEVVHGVPESVDTEKQNS